MGQGYVVEGKLFEDVDGNKTLDENEKGFEEIKITFDAVNGGSVSTTSTFDGNYDVILPSGIYNAYAHIGGEGQNLVALQPVILTDEDKDSNLSSNYGEDAIIIMYEEHLGGEIPLEGLVNLDGATTGALNVWADDPGSVITLPINNYDVTAQKYGYTFEGIYEVSEQTNSTKEARDTFELNTGKDLIPCGSYKDFKLLCGVIEKYSPENNKKK